jgi:Ni/Co efflux regulator RcnB
MGLGEQKLKESSMNKLVLTLLAVSFCLGSVNLSAREREGEESRAKPTEMKHPAAEKDARHDENMRHDENRAMDRNFNNWGDGGGAVVVPAGPTVGPTDYNQIEQNQLYNQEAQPGMQNVQGQVQH